MAALAASLVLGLLAMTPVQAETVRIAVLDPFSGPFAGLYSNYLRGERLGAELLKKQKVGGPYELEFTEFDSKGSPQESITQLHAAIDQGYRFILQGSGSGPAAALIDAIDKFNERNPGKEVVFLNYLSADPDLTNSKCSFWHFRFDANSDMRMEAITTQMAATPSVKKVYLINQNWPTGQQASRAAKEYLKRKRADIQIVGDDMHPIGQVKDFTPYVAKIKASGADSVITASFGADLALLVKAARESGLKVDFYTYYGASYGVPTAIGESGAERVKVLATWLPNNDGFAGKDIYETFHQRYKEDYVVAMPTYTASKMLLTAFEKNKSADPVKAAFAMEGMKVDSLNGEVEMRAIDHQAQQPLYVGTWTRVNGKDVRFDQENTGFGWRVDKKIATYVATQPTSCQMKRPAR